MTDEILTMSTDEAFDIVPSNILWMNVLLGVLAIIFIIWLLICLFK